MKSECFTALVRSVLIGCFSLIGIVSYSQTEMTRISSSGEEEKWVLAFGDEFDGNKLNTEKWTAVEGVPRDPYQDAARVWYSKNNVEVSNGLLKLLIKKDTLIDKPFEIWITDRMVPLKATTYFTSAEIHSNKQMSFGLYEIRCRIPKRDSLSHSKE